MNEINDRISAIVSATGLTKTAFAKQLNVTQQYISNLCLGKKTPSDRTITDICREFNVNEAWLRTGEGEMFDQKRKTAVDRLCAELCASELESEIIRAYFQISPQIREPFVRQLIQEMQSPTQGSGKDVHVHTTGQEQLETAEEISPQLPIGGRQSKSAENEADALTEKAEALYRSSSGYVASADSSASSSTADTGKTGGVKPA